MIHFHFAAGGGFFADRYRMYISAYGSDRMLKHLQHRCDYLHLKDSSREKCDVHYGVDLRCVGKYSSFLNVIILQVVRSYTNGSCVMISCADPGSQ